MTNKWTQCIKCKRTMRIPLNISDKNWICEDCRDSDYEPKKIYEQPLPKLD